MTETAPGPGWWRANDGRWYPPRDGAEPPGPGWWRANDGRWYPPRADGEPPAPGWWLASNGRWYPPSKATVEARADEPSQAATTEVAAGDEPPAAATSTPKKKVVKKVAVKKVVKKAPAKPAATSSTASTGAADPKGSPAKGAAKPTKKAATKATPPHVVRRHDLDDEPLPAVGRAGSPEEQIATRNRTSQQDAQFLAAARSKAALRAVGSLQAMIEAEKASATSGAASTKGPEAPEPPAGEPPRSTKKAPTASKVATHKAQARADAEVDGATIERASEDVSTAGQPLMEVKPSAVATDLDRIGERLVIFEDRVELQDRNGHARSRIGGEHIADVVVTKRFTGHVVTVEAGDGETIQIKGLRPEQAEEIRELIMRRTRRKGPAPARPAGSSGSPEKPATPAPAQADATAAELNAMLEGLHRAGVLTDAELAEKRALVSRLHRAERLASSGT